MNVMLASFAFVAAAACAALMGFAIQRGATCAVAAVDEIVNRRRAHRLAGFLEASLWVTGGLLVARALGVLPHAPAGYAIGAATILGGALLGFGAYVNRACVFGTLARLGSGEWAYIATPIGFYVGCASVDALFSPAPPKLAVASPVLQAATWLAWPVAALMLLRIGYALAHTLCEARATGSTPRAAFADRLWSPHAATTLIGITFFGMLLLAGTWAYTDVLAELARGMAANLTVRTVLLVALTSGAVAGGWTAGRFRSTAVSAARLARCFAGGVLMGWGSLLIPGGNDGLILVGMPLLWPYAWLAFVTMCVTIGAALVLARAFGPTLARVEHG
jgi:toxin CptA